MVRTLVQFIVARALLRAASALMPTHFLDNCPVVTHYTKP